MDVTEHKQLTRLLKQESDDLISYLETLTDDQWSVQSACEEWTVADVMGHLFWVFNDHLFDGTSRALRGDVSAPEGSPIPGSISRRERDRWLSDIAKRYSSEYGLNLLPEFKSYAGKVYELWGTLNPGNWDLPRYGFMGPQTISERISTPATETAVHHWDIRSRLHPDTAYLSTECTTLLMKRATGFSFFEPGAKLTAHERYRVVFDEYTETELDFVNEGDGAYVESPAQSKPEVTFRCDPETMVLIMYGRLALEEAEHANRISYEGESAAAHHFFALIGNS